MRNNKEEWNEQMDRQTDRQTGVLTEAEEHLVLLPLQVELVHLQQGVKLLPVDVVEDLLRTQTHRHTHTKMMNHQINILPPAARERGRAGRQTDRPGIFLPSFVSESDVWLALSVRCVCVCGVCTWMSMSSR